MYTTGVNTLMFSCSLTRCGKCASGVLSDLLIVGRVEA